MRQARDAFGRPIIPSDAAPPTPRIAPRPGTDGPQPAPQPEIGTDPSGPGDDPQPSSCLEQLWGLLKIVFVLFAIVSLVTKIVHHVGSDGDGGDSPAAVAEASSDADAPSDADPEDAPALYSRADVRLALDQVRSAKNAGDRVVSLIIGDGFVRLRLTAGRDRPIRELLLDSDGDVDGEERAGPNPGYRGVALSQIDAAAPGRLLADADLALTDADTVDRVALSAGKEGRPSTWSAFVDRAPAEGETTSRERWVGDAHGRHVKRGTT
jgi:hypothetical protein